MKRFKGTKGKWVVDREYTNIIVISDDKRGDIAECHEVDEHCNHLVYVGDGTDWVNDPKEVEANAQLIATAPEMLEVLIGMTLLMKAHPDYLFGFGRSQEFIDYVESGEKVINKALGL